MVPLGRGGRLPPRRERRVYPPAAAVARGSCSGRHGSADRRSGTPSSAGALTDVGYTITVTDTTTGHDVRQYVNEPYSLCGDADAAAFDAAF
jgi:hypothetical protein